MMKRLAEVAGIRQSPDGPRPGRAEIVRAFALISAGDPSGKTLADGLRALSLDPDRFLAVCLELELIAPVQDTAAFYAAYCQPPAPNPQMATYTVFKDDQACLRHFV